MAGRRQEASRGARRARGWPGGCAAQDGRARGTRAGARATRRLTPDETRALAIDRVLRSSPDVRVGEPFEDWDVGDYRFLVLDFSPKKNVGLYVQIWTEPGEPVLIEACSGAGTDGETYVKAPSGPRCASSVPRGRRRATTRSTGPIAAGRCARPRGRTAVDPGRGLRLPRAAAPRHDLLLGGRTKDGRVFPLWPSTT